MDRDRDRCRDPAFPVRIPALASPSPKTGHSHPHVIQSEKSNYFTTLSNSVVNEPPRLYPSKELSSYYEKASAGAQAVVASVGATVPAQGALSLGSYSSKASLSKPPPLIKHQPEGGEGLAGKITEQLSQQVTIVQQQHQHHTGMERIERSSPTISPSSTSSSSSFAAAPNHHHHYQQQLQQPQHQLRAMPSLHRAPVFHPPTQHALERKEAAEREKERERERTGYGGRLSPPTLTPIQPVSLASAGNKTLAEQQKPPTLMPELRDVKGHGNTAIFPAVASALSRETVTSTTDALKGVEMIQDHGGPYSGDRGVSRGKLQAATASVIVRPSTSIKYDSVVGANKSGATINKEFPQGRFNSSSLQVGCDRGERIKECGVGRIIQPNSNLDEICVQNKKTFVRAIQGPMGASPVNSVCRTANLTTPAFGPQVKSGPSVSESGYLVSARGDFSSHKTGGYLLSHSAPGEHQDGSGSRTTSPGGSLPPPSPAGTPKPSPSLPPAPLSISGPGQPYSTSFVHLKKHKAALAAAQSRSNFSISPTSITTGNSLTVESVDKIPVHNSPPPPSSSQASSYSVDSCSSGIAGGSTTPGKSSPVPNGHTSGSVSAGSGQPSNYHKLKKAWLTRHSEEDKNTTTTTTSTTISKPEKMPSTATSTSNTTAVSEMIKPCTVNLSASTSSEVEMSKDSGSKVERDRQLEEKAGGGEEKKAAHVSRRGNKRLYESGSESGGDDSDASETKIEGRAKRQPKPTYKKKQNDMAKKKGDNEKEDDDVKPNGIFRSAREKTKLKLASSSKFYRRKKVLMYAHDMLVRRGRVNMYVGMFKSIFLKKKKVHTNTHQ